MKKEMSKMSRESKWAMKENVNTLHSMIIFLKNWSIKKNSINRVKREPQNERNYLQFTYLIRDQFPENILNTKHQGKNNHNLKMGKRDNSVVAPHL